MLVLLSALALAAPFSGIAWPSEVRLGGFSADGSAVVWSAEVPAEFARDGQGYGLTLVTDPDGAPSRTFRFGSAPVTPSEAAPAVIKKMLSNSRPEAETEAFTSGLHLIDPVEINQSITGRSVRGGREPLVLSIASDHRRCPTRILVARLGSVSGAVAEDDCRKGDATSSTADD